MFKIKSLAHKTWAFAAAAAIIAGSSASMAFALNSSIPDTASANLSSISAAPLDNSQAQSPDVEVSREYIVKDLSGEPDQERKDLILQKLSLTKSITPEQVQEKYNEIIANMTPGKKDISAEQAAAYAANILKKAYGVNFTGYTAQASFYRNPVPNSDSWTVIFHAPDESNDSKRYVASVDSVKGTMLDASVFSLDFREENNTNLKDPAWEKAAEENVSKLMPENVSLVSSKVTLATPESGVMVVCEFSDGSACEVRLTGASKEAVSYVFFPKGYDGTYLSQMLVIEKAEG